MMSSHKFPSILVLVVVCVSVWGDVEARRCIEREREALLSFKNGLIEKFDILSSWRSDGECCQWDGVVCSNITGHVIALQLGSFEFGAFLEGKVSSSLLELHHLTYLDLSWNDFRRDRIPHFISFMKQLQHLHLRKCNFSGIVPPQLGNLTNLRVLDLSGNHMLSSPSLNWLSGLSLLSRLDLSHFFDLSVHTNWLQHILSLHSLQRLHLRSCNIKDVEPYETLFVNSSSTSLLVLDLSHNHLTSSAFDWLSNLSTRLVKMDLSKNALGGQIPDALAAFSALTELYLGSNKFRGSLPQSLGNLSNLRVLDVSSNSLEGAISESNFMRLHSLKMLNLSFNSLAMQIAPDWRPPFQLDSLDLAGCRMGPDFPKWIQTQRNLTRLDLSNAGIIDEVPKWFWSLSSSSLHYLSFSNNQISGTIPHLLSTSIQIIDVSFNKFSGPIPLFHANTLSLSLRQNMFVGSISSICNVPHDWLWLLDFSNNQLSGELPDCWEKMPNLFTLSLANNSFSGEIPHSLGSLHQLAALNLHDNNLSGELPPSFRVRDQLRLLDVGENKLTGYIPAWIGSSHIHMMYLSFRGNRFHGAIPPEICSLADIQVFDVSRNNLSGEIPDCFNNFTSLAQKNTTFHLNVFGCLYLIYRSHSSTPHLVFARDYDQYSLVQWKGKESEYRRTLKLLKLIDFSSNRLTGNIPESFSSMRGLISLNLSRNSLTGNIIPDIGQMEMLKCLDLSKNKLSGKIPTGLAQLHSLAVLDLSNNNMSGKIPTSTQLQSFDIASYAGNNGLCGRPLPLCREDNQRPPATADGERIHEKDDGFWRVSFIQDFGISMIFGFIVGFWGVVALFILKRCWRNAYFNLLDGIGDWLYVRTAIFLSRFR